jgi:hypothetical protein
MNPIAPAGFRLGEIVNRFRSGQSGKARRAKAGGLIRRPIRIRGAAAVESCDVRRRASRHHGILGRARQRRTEEQCKACHPRCHPHCRASLAQPERTSSRKSPESQHIRSGRSLVCGLLVESDGSSPAWFPD